MQRLQALILKTKLNDRELAEKLGVSQPTAWRLRNGKIRKVSGYIAKLERALGQSATPAAKSELESLIALAEQSPALKQTLIGIMKLILENE